MVGLIFPTTNKLMKQITFKKISTGVYEKTEIFEDVRNVKLVDIDLDIQRNKKRITELDKTMIDLGKGKNDIKIEIKRLEDLKKHLESLS